MSAPWLLWGPWGRGLRGGTGWKGPRSLNFPKRSYSIKYWLIKLIKINLINVHFTFNFSGLFFAERSMCVHVYTYECMCLLPVIMCECIWGYFYIHYLSEVHIVPPSAYVHVGMCTHLCTCRQTCIYVGVYNDIVTFQQSLL